jgi:hypothetical protein
MTIFAGHHAASASILHDPKTEVVMRGVMWFAVSMVVGQTLVVGVRVCG